MQAQILGEDLRGLYGVLLRAAPGRDHEQAVLVHTWRAESGIAYPRGPQERKSHTLGPKGC